LISGRTRIYGLVGHPVRHSLSPAMHNALFGKLSLDAVYLAFDVDPRRAEGVTDAIRTLDLVGVNLTVPFKERVLPHLDHVTIAAEEAGAVNVVINVDGWLTGYNTDGEGLLGALAEEHGFNAKAQRCVVLGAGGAGRAVASALAAAGAQAVTLLNRDVARAERAAAQLGERHPGCSLHGAPLHPGWFGENAEGADLVVNCLGGGTEALVESLPIAPLPSSAIWCDINYWMSAPPRLSACAARGLRTSSGLGMLVHQGALSFELFTGYPIAASELRDTLEAKR
jgi:shikimate dehydrogenase